MPRIEAVANASSHSYTQSMTSANASHDSPPFADVAASPFKHKLVVGVAGFVGGWIGDKFGEAIGAPLPLVPRRLGRIAGGALGGYLGARALVSVTKLLLKDASPTA